MKISFQYPSSSYSQFNILEISEEAYGVQFDTGIAVKEFIGSEILTSLTVNNISMPLTKDLIINGNFTLKAGNLNLAGHRLTVVGDMTQTGGTININGGEIVVEENLLQTSGTMNIGGGRLEVEVDYKIQGSNGSHSSGILKMMNENDYLSVGGSFLTDSRNSHENYLTAGTMEVKGDFTQKSTYGWSPYSDRKNFHASGTHKVILSGNATQIISFQYPSSGYSHFNILLLTKPFSSGYTFNQIPVWNYLIEVTVPLRTMAEARVHTPQRAIIQEALRI